MGRGRSGATGTRGRGRVETGELQLPNGSTAEFDGDLVYGQKDPNIPPAARQAVEQWEAKRVKAKVEYAYSVTEDGDPIGPEKRGSKGSVRVPYTYHDTKDATFTHIHPRGSDGILGGTFSRADMRNFAIFDNKTVRAAAGEGTYSISKNANFDRQGFLSYVKQIDGNFSKNMKAKDDSLVSRVRSGNLDWGGYQKAYAKEFNTELVSLHNAYLAGQKKYGYTYTLEERP